RRRGSPGGAAPLPSPATPRPGPALDPRPRHYAALFVVSACLMIQELATARVLSVALPSHYAFVAISVAMFGIGLGGLLVFLLPNAFRADRVDRQAVAYLACFGVAAAVADFAFLHLHVVQALSWAGFVTLSAAYLVLAVPFLCAGLCIAILMTHFARRTATLYAADLLG